MCAAKRMNVRVHVFSGDSEDLCTIFQRGLHRKLEDQARGSVPDALPVAFCLGGSLADRVGGFEELAPAPLGRSEDGAAPFEESRRAGFGEARTSSMIHGSIVTNSGWAAQVCERTLRTNCPFARPAASRSRASDHRATRSCRGGASSGTVIGSTATPSGVDSIQVAWATKGCSPVP